MVEEIKSLDEWDNLLSTGDPVVLKFWATWCGPCKQFAPHFEQVEKSAGVQSSRLGRAKFVQVDIDEVPELAERYGVMSIPAVKLFDNGELKAALAQTPQERTAVRLSAELKLHIG